MHKVLRNLTQAAAVPAKTSSQSAWDGCMGQCMRWLVQVRCGSNRSGTHQGKPNPCCTISSREVSLGFLRSSRKPQPSKFCMKGFFL